MNKIDLDKNRLDLSYKRNLQLLNSILIIGAGSIVIYFAGLILDSDKIFEYSVILLIVSVLTIYFYNRINQNLKHISEHIRDLI